MKTHLSDDAMNLEYYECPEYSEFLKYLEILAILEILENNKARALAAT